MRIMLLVAFGFGAVTLASPASAKQYYYCYTKAYNKDTLIHYSPIMASEVGRIDDRKTGFAFSEFAKSAARSNGSIDTGCSSSSRLDVITRYYEAMLKDGAGSGTKVDWPNPPVASNVPVASPNEVSITFSDSARAAINSGNQSRYVEVDGAKGKMRLSPEVIARNRAAEEEFRRKSDEHAREMAEHNRKLAQHQQSISQAAAEKRAHEQRLAANAAQIASHQAALLEHRKLAAKPAGVNAIYRGFGGPTCEFARRSAVLGSGTSKGTHFNEVTQDLSGMPRWCIVQGWSWNTSRTGSSRQ